MEEVDRLSLLPDPILAHILSFLPTEDAVKTVLLRAFGHLWTSTNALDFEVKSCSLYFTHPKDHWYAYFIDQVLLHHDLPVIDKFALKFTNAFVSKLYPSNSDASQNFCKLDRWIHFAIMKEVKLLKLDMLDRNLYGPLFSYNLPDFVLKSDSLVELKLVSCIIRPLSQINMRSLKSLSLTTISLNDTMVKEILLGCPLLERLCLIRCSGIYKMYATPTNLKILEVALGENDTSKFEISCPNIKSIKFMGSIARAQVKNSSFLVDATLEFFHGGRYSYGDYENVGLLLEDLSHAKSLTVCDWCVLVFTIQALTCRAFSFSGCKRITLKTKLTKWHMFGIACLLNNSPSLEILTVYIEPDTSILTSDDVMWLQALGIYHNNPWNNQEWLKSHDFHGENFWNLQHHFACLKGHLKCVKIHGCVENLYVIELVKFLLRCSIVLEKMMIISEHSALGLQQHHQHLPENLPDISQKLKYFPKASENAVIIFS